MNIYNQRASMGSTDALSIIYRDIIINIFWDMMNKKESELLKDVIVYFEKTQNMNLVLEHINDKYYWGETIR